MTATTIDRLGVLSSVQRVVELSRYVHVDETAIDSAAPGLARRVVVPEWDRSRHRIDATEQTCNWLLVLDAVNFSFWGDPRWQVDVEGQTLDGYYALVAALSRATDEGIPIHDAAYLARLTIDDARRIFRGHNEIPMIDRRVENLNEVGEVLLDRYEGQFARAIEEAGGSATRLVRSLVASFSYFDDVSEFKGVEVRFYKRAQLLVSDLYGAFAGESWGRFTDLDQLTAFADYKLPQVLRRMGILTYLPSLDEKIEARFLLPAGSREEVEIRAHTVWAVDRLARALNRRGNQIRPFELDWWLWHEGQRLGPGARKYHRTRTINY
ncbi:MAG: hypothetical protein EPO26_00990 [Chloroflexota bacterium]|nr:MAG: hypothetical protein EPO26_00990 [Chloroflexota bacterium]